MADIQVSPQVVSTAYYNRRIGPIWKSQLTGYIVYDNGSDIVYKKTTDGGQTWGADVIVIQPAGGHSHGLAVWWDKWTSDDRGSLIHVVSGGNSLTVAVRYRNLDTAADTLGTEYTVIASQVPAGYGSLSLTKARNGYLFLTGLNGATHVGLQRSVDGGVTWTSRTSPLGAPVIDYDLHPGNEADPADVWLISYNDTGGFRDLWLKVYDNSANTWSSALITTGGPIVFPYRISSTTRQSDNHVIVIAPDNFWNAVHNIKCWDIASAASITPKTNVVTGIQYENGTNVFYDQLNDILYVAYVRGATGLTDEKIYYRTSTDGGTTWSAEFPYSVSTSAPTQFLGVLAGLSVPLCVSGRFEVVWFLQTADDYYTNYDNSVAIINSDCNPILPSIYRRYNMPVTAQINAFSRLWLIENRAGPGNPPSYEGLWSAGRPSWSLGDVTPIHIPSEQEYGHFDVAGKILGDRGSPNLAVTARYRADALSTLLRLARLGCDHDLQIHFGQCQDPQDFNGGWQKILALEAARPTEWASTEMGAMSPGDQSPVNE